MRGFSSFLNDVRDRAEAAAQIPWGDDATLRAHGHVLVQLMRDKRATLLAKLAEIRAAADGAINALH